MFLFFTFKKNIYHLSKYFKTLINALFGPSMMDTSIEYALEAALEFVVDSTT